MQNLVIAVVVIFGGWWLLRKLVNAQPAQVRQLMRKVLGVGLMGLAGIFTLRGGAAIAMPLFALGLGLFGQQALFPNGFPWQQKTPGQRSRVATAMLAMELDHDSGTMEGEVLAGPFKGRRLSELAAAELRKFHAECVGSGDQSATLLEAWLDRNRQDWREKWGAARGEAGKGSSASGAMGREEAYAVLGLKAGAGGDAIRAAHRRLMKEFHPDKGGSDYLAAKINQAKDILLQD